MSNNSSIFKSIGNRFLLVIVCSIVGGIFFFVGDESVIYGISVGLIVGIILCIPSRTLHTMYRHWKEVLILLVILTGQWGLVLLVILFLICWKLVKGLSDSGLRMPLHLLMLSVAGISLYIVATIIFG